MTPPSDSGFDAILNEARKQDTGAVKGLLEGYHPYIQVLARRAINHRLQGKLDASDLLRQTLMEARYEFPHFRGTTERDLLAWLRQILISNLANQSRRYFNNHGRDVHLERDLAIEVDISSRLLERWIPASGSLPSCQETGREHAVFLASILAKLPDDDLEVIILKELEGCSFSEVAAQMARSPYSVKKLWAKALARVRGLLSERFGK